jgi:hypothetical protein
MSSHERLEPCRPAHDGLDPAHGSTAFEPAQFPSSIRTAQDEWKGPCRVVASARIGRRLPDRGPVSSAGEEFLREWWAADAGFDGSRRRAAGTPARIPRKQAPITDIDRPKIKVTARHPIPHSDVRDDALGGVWSIERQ